MVVVVVGVVGNVVVVVAVVGFDVATFNHV